MQKGPVDQQVDAGHAVLHVAHGGLALHQLPGAGVGAAVQQAVGVHGDCRMGQQTGPGRERSGGEGASSNAAEGREARGRRHGQACAATPSPPLCRRGGQQRRSCGLVHLSALGTWRCAPSW